MTKTSYFGKLNPTLGLGGDLKLLVLRLRRMYNSTYSTHKMRSALVIYISTLRVSLRGCHWRRCDIKMVAVYVLGFPETVITQNIGGVYGLVRFLNPLALPRASRLGN